MASARGNDCEASLAAQNGGKADQLNVVVLDKTKGTIGVGIGPGSSTVKFCSLLPDVADMMAWDYLLKEPTLFFRNHVVSSLRGSFLWMLA